MNTRKRRKPGSSGSQEHNSRAIAARIATGVAHEGRTVEDALTGGMDRVPAQDRPLVREMVYGTLRFWFRLGARLAPFLKRRLRKRDADIDALLRVGAYQLEFLAIPRYAAVRETAEAARSLGKPWAVGLVNAILRQVSGTPPPPRWPATDEASSAHPGWLVERLRQAWPADWDSVLAAGNRRPPLSLRVNARRNDRDAYMRELAAAGVRHRPIPHTAHGIELAELVDVTQLPGYGEGWFSVQDGAAQLAAPLLDPRQGERVLDACAAPGGKTAHILEQADCELTAVELEAARIPRLRENLERLGLRANVHVADATLPDSWWDGQPYDRILIDAPCSGTGVIRRHPDIKLLRRAADVAELSGRQRHLLKKLWPLLKRNGILVYATCSVLPEENAQVVRRFLGSVSDAKPIWVPCAWGWPVSPGWQVLPGNNGMDGFYYVLLRKL